jgi:hypothetical protein
MAAATARDANAPAALTTAELHDLLRQLARLEPAPTDADRIDQLTLLESVKAAAAGAQARVTVAFAESQREAQAVAGVPARRRGTGIAAQVALARRDSPVRGSRHLGFAEAMVHEMPRTMAHLSAGRVSEWRATVICRETACLTREDRAAVDEALALDLPSLGDRQVESRARALAAQLDAESVARRAARAQSDRCVTLRPAPDTMTYLTALLPVQQGVAAYAALCHAADSGRAEGDLRGRGQVMADTLVERLTGQATADAVPLDVHVVVSGDALTGRSDEPALFGGQVVDASSARSLVARAHGSGAAVRARRVWTDPTGRDLAKLEHRTRRLSPETLTRLDAWLAEAREIGSPSTVNLGAVADRSQGPPPTARFARGWLRRFVTLRDQHCRTPWCDAPIRHLDHVLRRSEGGATSKEGLQGLCEACNYAKEAAGWRHQVIRGSPHLVRVTTPTGHTHLSVAPPILPCRGRATVTVYEGASPLESRYEALLLSA